MSITIVLSSAIAFIIYLLNINNVCSSYQAITILPLIYAQFAIIIYRKLRWSSSTAKITIYIFLAIQWLRFVVLPAIGSVSGYFSDLGPYVSNKSALVAVWLLIAELVISSLFCFIILQFSRKRKGEIEKQSIKIKGVPAIYIVFIFTSIILFFLTGADAFTFIALKPATSLRLAGEIGDNPIISAIISFGLMFLVILIFYKSYICYQKTAQKKYVYFALFCALIRLCLISSEGRLSQVYLVYVFIWILPRLFPRYRKEIIRNVLVIACIVIGLLTIYKVFYVFSYDSYLSAIKNNNFDLYLLSNQIDSYFYSVKTVARNLEFAMISNVSFFTIIFDFLRNTFGLHYFFKNTGYTTSELYNLYIYSGTKTSGYLFSVVAYGYLYLGPLLAPLFTCFNMAVAAWVERKIVYVKYLEVQYIMCIIYARLSFAMFASFAFNWNIISRTLVICWVIITFASFPNRVKQNQNLYICL
ncbi:hypothetical protein SpiGrapes_1656 [Sphaerochaeta pleomorpha str. Grapes]|uniref:Oligosaccharide repeat unit polymerase n=1 Tax=Sphaerochaeta pleomorpha (strain ATCC BAA-1885 / DSM 22778 / Grapes) TaxID=158190 RepID=G8QWV5_SPHPG|nr:oligosaccharide repeat unit polymerase [Sphaerochaeta pleomorpha]AEV29459.1 hypothetical protein SpiGrapes_1656 [Sphaerochaeta pleomorpha str. Grapes]